MSIASVSHTHVFGLSASTAKDNIFYVDENTIVFPAGCNIVGTVADIEQKMQKFIPASDKAEGISAITVSPDRHVFAVSEKSTRPSISVYDLHSFRKRRTVHQTTESQGLAKEFVSLAFSSDARYLAAQLGAPEWLLHYFAWEKGKLIAVTCSLPHPPPEKDAEAKSIQQRPDASGYRTHPTPHAVVDAPQPSGTILSISICPTDGCQISALGESFLRIFHYLEGVLEPLHVQAPPNTEFRCHTWLPNERIAIGTASGTILISLSGEIVSELQFGLPVAPSTAGPGGFHAGAMTMHQQGNQEVRTTGPVSRAVNTVAAIGRGFLAAGQGGAVEVFERFTMDVGGSSGSRQGSVVAGSKGSLVNLGDKSEKVLTKDSYKMMWRLPLPEDSASVRHMAVSGSEGGLLVALETNQLYKIPLTWSDLLKGEDVKFEQLFQPFHHGSVTGLDLCCRKPILVTCSTDKSIKVWNYMTGTCELSKYFPEEAHSVSLHPSGLYLLVGFSDKLRLLNVLMDEFRLFKEFPIRGCKECKFSNGGHIFAAVHGNMIQLYSLWTFDNIGNLKGHNGKVRSLHWTPDDSVLVSAGSDGAVYTWVVRDLKRENEHILKSCSYTSATCSVNGKTVYAVGSDKVLKEINESTVTCQMESNVVLTQVVTSKSGKMMFAGTASGQIRSLKYPLTGEADDYQEHQAHSGPITKLRISYDDQFLFSVSDDGCIYVYRVSDKEDRGIRRDRSTHYADEILITKSDLEEKTVLMSELQRSLEELKLEHEYQLRLKDMNFNEKLKELTEKFSQEIEALKISTSVLRTEKDKEEVKHEEELQGFKGKHLHELHEVEAKYNQQLMEEYEKFQDLQAKAGQRQEQWQKQMKEFNNITARALSDAQAEAEARLNMKSAEIARLNDETHQQLAEYEEMGRQNCEDVDSEIQLLAARYEKKLRSEREEGARLKGENGIMKKKFNTLKKDIEDNKNEIQRMFEDEKKLKSAIAMLEKEIAAYKKDMQERDELIQDKERRVYDLKKKNQELEKHKFVLDFRIKALKEQVEPRENTILEMTRQIRDINLELEILNKQKGLLTDEISDVTTKLTTTKLAYSTSHRRFQDITHHLKVFRNDLQDAMQYIQEPATMRKCVENLHRRYCAGKGATLENNQVDPEVRDEYLRQHAVLKEQIAELRDVCEVSQGAFRTDKVHSMMENQLLIG
ncbi:Cilia- and flagella-associated protein 57 [Irineochytrium annulatum]|nr:Cilia- and flagella-associated protein 57 [Irineochytrium annulatum]